MGAWRAMVLARWGIGADELRESVKVSSALNPTARPIHTDKQRSHRRPPRVHDTRTDASRTPCARASLPALKRLISPCWRYYDLCLPASAWDYMQCKSHVLPASLGDAEQTRDGHTILNIQIWSME